VLVRIALPFAADCVPKGCRERRRVDFVGEETVEIADISAKEAPTAYLLFPQRDEKDDARLPLRVRRLVAYGGRLYWPVFDGHVPLRVRHWIARLGQGGPTPLPDVFGLDASLHGREWPTRRFDEAAVRRMVENGRDEAAARVHREAAGLLLVGGRLYRCGGEPVWLVRADQRRYDCVGQAVFRDVIDAASPVRPADGADQAGTRAAEAPIPFVNYEVFRADRGGDAMEFANRRVAAPEGRGYYREPDRWRLEPKARPSADVLTPMLRGLHDCVVGLVAWGAYWTRRDLGLPQDMADSEVASRHGREWLRRIAALDPAPADATVHALGGWVCLAVASLDGVDTGVDVFGWVETIRLAMKRAGERLDHDVGAELVARTDEDREDDAALASLA
jgi:hypothetical protein